MRWPRILWIAGTVLLATMVVHIVALAIRGGPVTGPVSLRKPADFAETGWLLTWSVALILPRLRTRAWQRHVIGGSAVLFGVGETAVMAIQAWRGGPSHLHFHPPPAPAPNPGRPPRTPRGVLIGVTRVILLA